MIKDILFELVIFLSNIIQCISGFAGTVLAMPFSLMLVGYHVAKPILNVLGIASSSGVVLLDYKQTDLTVLKKSLPFLLSGLFGGMILISHIHTNGRLLYHMLGLIVLFTAVVFAFLKLFNIKYRLNTALSVLILLAAGFVHGMFVCGGPLLVLYCAAKTKDSFHFRVTISSYWIILNTLIMFHDILMGSFDFKGGARFYILLFVALAMLSLAVFIGRWLARRLSKKVFSLLTALLMAISGISLLIK